jgi:hypothetical protein
MQSIQVLRVEHFQQVLTNAVVRWLSLVGGHLPWEPGVHISFGFVLVVELLLEASKVSETEVVSASQITLRAVRQTPLRHD